LEKLTVGAGLVPAQNEMSIAGGHKARPYNFSRPIRLGSLTLAHNVILSPMVGVTDAPFRRLCAQGGSALMSGEMLSAQAINYKNEKTLRMLRFYPDERPVSSQIMGSEPEIMAQAAKKIEACGADLVDINAGCPVPKITKTKSGSALLKDEGRFAAILSAVVKAVAIPVTVKIRIGVRANEYLAPALAKLAQECGVGAVIVHARPVSARHSGRPDWEGLRQVVEGVRIPVIGNGGVNAPKDAADFLKISGCAGVSVGRAAIGDPAIFARIRHYLASGELLPEATHGDKLDTLAQHVIWAADFFGERQGLLRMRKIVPYYVAGFPMATAFRSRANKIATLKEWTELIDETRQVL
jgi:tRNA-dihydrouridine synthase B